MLANGGQLELTFDLGVSSGETVVCMVYVNGEWIPVELVNNGDGTVTCLFSQICPVVFCVRENAIPPQTGDTTTDSMIIWAVIMGSAIVALAVVLVIYRKKFSKN